MKLVLFQSNGDASPGLLTERGVVSIAGAVAQAHTPQLTMQGVIDGFDRLRPALERLAQTGEARPRSSSTARRSRSTAATPRTKSCLPRCARRPAFRRSP